MKIITQNQQGIFGTDEEIEKLKKLEEATILVLSDSHRNTENFRQIIEEFGPKCNAMVFCGDGARDLASIINSDVFSEAPLLPPVIAFVRGNGDPSQTDINFDPYSIKIPETQILEAAGKKIYISHGHLQGIDYSYSLFEDEAEKNDCQIILHGHTHVTRHYFTENRKHLFCPGSISLPRCGTPKSFCILTIKGNYVDGVFMEIKNTGFESFNPVW